MDSGHPGNWALNRWGVNKGLFGAPPLGNNLGVGVGGLKNPCGRGFTPTDTEFVSSRTSGLLRRGGFLYKTRQFFWEAFFRQVLGDAVGATRGS